jgi:hypothetical protein
VAGLGASLALLGHKFEDDASAGGGGAGANERVLTEGIGVSESEAAIRRQPVLATDNVGAHAALTPRYGVQLFEQLGVLLSQITNQHGHISASDALGLHEIFQFGYPVSLTSGVGIAPAQLAQQLIRIVEALQLTPTLVPIFIYHLGLSDSVSLFDTLDRFFTGEVIETIAIAPTQSAVALRRDTVTEGLGIAGSLTTNLVLRVVTTDAIHITPAQALKMLYKPILTEEIELSAVYLSPGGGVITWTMNTRTGAVTEYDNYAFNSFARIGDKYIGASESGLYELLGDDDAGADIVATIRSGFAQWSGTHMGSFKGMYLATRGEGDFILKVITADNKEYHYAVAAQDSRTTKITTGKGLRARYFAFELISTGQDFNLDTIEFIPLVADRRV